MFVVQLSPHLYTELQKMQVNACHQGVLILFQELLHYHGYYVKVSPA